MLEAGICAAIGPMCIVSLSTKHGPARNENVSGPKEVAERSGGLGWAAEIVLTYVMPAC